MAIIKWDPYRDIVTLRDRMNRLFEDMSGPRSEEKDIMGGAWAPSVDIYENENEVVLAAEIPGVDEKDVEIKVEDNNLTLRGERRFEKETQEENYHRIERSYGSFFRSFAASRPNTRTASSRSGCPSGPRSSPARSRS
jgi:HSP20 family protein